jgi:hypothetical protein
MNEELKHRGFRQIMGIYVPGFVLVLLGLLFNPNDAHAHVTDVVITHCTDVLGGKPFGETGAYEKCVGTIYFALDPQNPRNRIIVDLDKAPRNAMGQIEFSSDLFVLRPKDPSRGNEAIFFDVVNRGNKLLLGRFNLAEGAIDPTSEAEFGDGFLMQQGYTLVAVGWEATPNTRAVSLYPPRATENGQPITGLVSNWFIPLTPTRAFEITSSYWSGFEEYPPLYPTDPTYQLTERLGYHGEQRVLPRDSWEFGQMVDGVVTYDPTHVFLWTGFRPGYTYQLTYRSKDPLVNGVGFAALRDAASYFKYNPEAEIQGRYAYAYGVSQTGRYLRQLIHEGFTVDEGGERKAFDGVFVHAGGSSLGPYNERFGQPNDGGFHSQTKFPILYHETRDPATGKTEGLGSRIPDGLHPKVVLYETSSEYWDRGRVAALNHTSIDGSQDVDLAENVRFYVMASIPHSNGSLPPARRFELQERANPIDVRFSMRALLVGMDQWVQDGELPPASRYPTLSAGTLIDRDEIKFPEIPGVQWPYHVPGGYRSDLPGQLTDNPLPFLVSDVDDDGNEVDGFVLPELAVPLGTYTGWAFRSERAGAPREILMMAGSYVPFPRTREERREWGDPRLSLEERYDSRTDYLRRFEEQAAALADEGYLLEQDLEQVVSGAASHWDWVMEQSSESLRP